MATDFDFDGDVDILLANDFGEFHIPNKLYKNEIDEGIFVEVSEEWNANQQMYAMGIASADFELDGDLDYYITNFGKNALLVNDDDAFSELAVDLGVDDTWIIEDSIFSVSWGTAFFDFDNDLFSDLYVANGYVPGPGFLPSRVRNQDKFYMNLGDLQFEELTPGLSGLDNELVNRGMAYSDFDLDGDLDLMTAAMRVPQNDLTIRSKFFINNLASENNWLKIKLQGVISNYNGIGALIKVYVGGFCLTKEVHGGSSHCSQNTLIQHFGLKDFEMIDSVVIDWPSQTKGQVLYDITSNQLLTIEEDINLSTNNDSYTDEGLKIYPSPSSGIIYIKDSENILELVNTIQLNDIHGSLIKSDIPINNTLDLSSVQDGIYIITFQFKNGDILNRKLIIQK